MLDKLIHNNISKINEIKQITIHNYIVNNKLVT